MYDVFAFAVSRQFLSNTPTVYGSDYTNE